LSDLAIKYVIISPVRDEAKFISRTAESILGQTNRPSEWIIVDDGSTDETARIIDGYASEYPWIRAVHRTNRGFRQSGGGVIEAFNDGYNAITSPDWEFVVKLDGDLIFDEKYFEHCFERFRAESRLGIGGGTIYHLLDGKECLEECPRFHVRGATKIYRRECWKEIGGLWQAPGWDTIDELKAQMLQWKTETFPDIKIQHQRLTGTAENLWNDLVKNGRARYIAGYHPLFLLATCILRLFSKPYIVRSAGLLWGYVQGYIKKVPRVDDPALIRFVRREQLKRLLGRQTVWN
jgi:glycosyltransferase involved in cell wall biosynthesis